MVATHGDASWSTLADERAVPSARALDVAVIQIHGDDATLAETRNAGAALAETEWLIFLDADDELEAGYVEALRRSGADLRAPAVRYVLEGQPVPEPITYHERNIDRINPCVIGTAVRRDLFDRVGGFWNERAFEDWSLFRRCWLAGAVLEHVPDAVYRATVNPAGRNSTVPRRVDLCRQIRRSHTEWKRRTLR